MTISIEVHTEGNSAHTHSAVTPRRNSDLDVRLHCGPVHRRNGVVIGTAQKEGRIISIIITHLFTYSTFPITYISILLVSFPFNF